MRVSLCLITILLIPAHCYSQSTVYSLAVDRAYDGYVYTSGYCDGMWVGDADLNSWDRCNNGLSTNTPFKYYTILCTAIAPSNGNIMYCGTSKGYVYRSGDRGDNWANTGLKLRKGVRAVAIDPSDSEHLFAASSQGLYAHTDGSGWKKVFFYFNTIFTDVAFDPSDSKIVYAVTVNFLAGGTLYRSDDSGKNWTRTAFDSGLHRIGLDPDNEGTMYITTYNGVLKTTDDGENWSFLSSGLSDKIVGAIAVDPVDSDVVYAGTWNGVYVTDDGGSTWVNTNIIEDIVLNLAFSQDENMLYICTAKNGMIKEDFTE